MQCCLYDSAMTPCHVMAFLYAFYKYGHTFYEQYRSPLKCRFVSRHLIPTYMKWYTEWCIVSTTCHSEHHVEWHNEYATSILFDNGIVSYDAVNFNYYPLSQGPFYKQGWSTLIPEWMKSYIDYKVLVEITYPWTSMVVTLLKFWNGSVISSRTSLDIWLLIHAEIKEHLC